MQNYYIITTKDEVIPITENEFKNLSKANGVVYISSTEQYLNTSFIYRAVNEDQYKKHLLGQRSKITNGRLHDGTRVVKKFGTWKLLGNPEVTINPDYYPEIAKDEVMTEEEWDNKKNNLKLK